MAGVSAGAARVDGSLAEQGQGLATFRFKFSWRLQTLWTGTTGVIRSSCKMPPKSWSDHFRIVRFGIMRFHSLDKCVQQQFALQPVDNFATLPYGARSVLIRLNRGFR